MTVVVAAWCSGGCVLVYWLWGPSLVQPRHIFLFQTEAASPPPSPRPGVGELELSGQAGGGWGWWWWWWGLAWAWTGSESLGPGWGQGCPTVGLQSYRDTQSGGRCPTSQTPVRSLNKTKKTLSAQLTMVERQTQADSGLTTSKKIVVAIQLFTPSLSVKINAAKSSYFPQSGARRAATL